MVNRSFGSERRDSKSYVVGFASHRPQQGTCCHTSGFFVYSDAPNKMTELIVENGVQDISCGGQIITFVDSVSMTQ